MAVLEDLSEDEAYLVTLLMDHSGLDHAEFLWFEPDDPDGCFRAWPYQWSWWRSDQPLQVDQCARSVGKSLSIKVRGFAFPFLFPNQEMVITAPEKNHLQPIGDLIENQLMATRLSREMLNRRGASNGIKHQPLVIDFANGARIMGRIPQRDGKGVKGIHPIWLELDEAQDYPHAAWMELVETLKRGHAGAVWRAHGVTRGVQDDFFKFTQDGSDWRVHRYTAMSRPNWTDEERQEKINTYGSKDHPDYRRNVLGSHGDAGNPLFVLSRLMRCVDDDQVSDFNLDTYYYKRLNDEMLRDLKMEAAQAIDFPSTHFNDDFKAYWIGCDFGWTRDPSEFLVWAEEKAAEGRKSRLRLITRIHMDRITAPQQTRVLLALLEAYHPKACAMDSTGAGLPVFQQLQELVEVMPNYRWALDVIKGYNFSSKIVVDIDQTVEVDEFFGDPAKDAGIERNVLEYSTDKLREYVDQERLLLPWDTDLIGEYTGQTYVRVAGMDAYGRRKFSGGKDHCLDASRLAVLGHAQLTIEALLKPRVTESVFDILG